MRERRKKAGDAGRDREVASSSDHVPRIPWASRLWASVGLPWIVVGITSYTLLTVAGQAFLHQPEALLALKREVPVAVYDRSTSIFLTALAIDLLNIAFERSTIKADCVLLPAFIKGMASSTNLLVRFFKPVLVLTNYGRPVVVQRYICWMHTTPTILMLLKMISSTITPREAMTAIFWDEIMVITGLLGLVTTGWQRVLWSIVTHVAMIPVVPYMHKAFTECMHSCYEAKVPLSLYDTYGRKKSLLARAIEQVRTRPLQLTMLSIYVLNLVLWCVFAITWDLALLDWISVQTEEVLYLCCDFSAKVLFSSTLMLSSFKEIEVRRETAMRVIENSSKAKLIAELQALLEQKERFMSSVSHELRTPLNGIIGISEGMLSGCCGVLPEGVRRQIYIIRTSGARLLALINDVMDAAALRQNKLVLKQEQVILRHVVDDVLDLTRSLVDSEVSLVNLVPPRMLVVGDTGRIVQILNNLLGNAAKFTRRGQIRVSARQVEGGRKVAVTVSDTGIGIPRNKLATIFLPFEQVDMSISRKYGGFGLGLNIVQELVKAHGGAINVSSIEGKGSAFTFTLPLVRAMGRESLDEAKALAQRTTAAVGGAGMPVGPESSVGSRLGGGGSTSGSGPHAATTATNTTGRTGTTTGPATSGSRGAGSRAGPSGGADGDGGGGGDVRDDRSSSQLSSSDASRQRSKGRGGQGGASTMGSEMEQYTELSYNAAELSALASSRPYAQPPRESASHSSAAHSSVAHSPMAAMARGGVSAPARGAAAASAIALVATPAAGGGASPPPGADAHAAGAGDAKIVHGPRPFHYTMYKRFLLLSVDDDHVNQSVVKSLLSSTGYEVVAVPSGPEALRYVASAPALPDLVLLDCMMPEMDGYEVLQRLRVMTPHVHLPIIMVSAQTEEDHVVCGLDLGADDYVTKPFKRNELLARIRAQLAYGDWEQEDAGAVFETISHTVADHAGTQHAPPHRSGTGGLSGAGLGHGILDSGFGLTDDDDLANGGALATANLGGGMSTGASGGDSRLILCVDDDDVNQVVLQGMLSSQHYRYVRASTGSQGLAYVLGPSNGGIPPDLVLVDTSLPDMTGFDVCRCIRQMYNKQQVPIIMLSARHNESSVVEGLKCGANTYVTKPFRRNELLARIRLHLRPRNAPMHRVSSAEPPSSPHHAHNSGGDSAAPSASHAAAAAAALAEVAAPAARASAAAAPAAAAAAAAPPAAPEPGVRVWPGAAVLVVAVADYVGLCRMLLPGEMADLTTRMLAAFDRAVASAHGAVKVEAGSGVMSAAMLPPAGAAVGGHGLRLAALHRVGRALLEAAATITVPGTTTCLQLQQALALGDIMGAEPALPPNPGSPRPPPLLFGPVLSELLDLARLAPPMTIVTPDAEAAALRASGATADIRGPLFLEAADGAAAGGAAARRLWLVEAHPLSHQYLPPQLLYDGNAMRSAGGYFRSATDESDKASVAASAGGHGGFNTGSAATPPGSMRRPTTTAGGGPAGSSQLPSGLTPLTAAAAAAATAAAGGVSPFTAGGGGGPTVPPAAASEMAHAPLSTASVSGLGISLGLYGPTAGVVSRGVSRAFSHTIFDTDPAGGAVGRHVTQPAASGGGTHGTTTTTGTSGNTAGGGSSTGAFGGGAAGGGERAAGAVGVAGVGPLGSSGAGGNGRALLDPHSAGITFSLQAAAAAVAAAAAAGGGSAHHGAAGSVHQASSTTTDAPSGVLLLPNPVYGSAGGGGGGGGGGGASYLYGAPLAGARSSIAARGSTVDAASPRSSQANIGLDPDIAAAEPQIRALRNELAIMRQQLEALHHTSSSGLVYGPGGAGAPTAALPSAVGASAGQPLAAAHDADGGGPSLVEAEPTAARAGAYGGGGDLAGVAGVGAAMGPRQASVGGDSLAESSSLDKSKKSGSKLSRLFKKK